jgi:putative chitinase
MLKLLFTAFALLVSPFTTSFANASENSVLNHTETELLATSTCKTKINGYTGTCIRPVECDGAIYNNLCPGIAKCCVEDLNEPPMLYWRYVSFEDFKIIFPLLGDKRSETLYPWFNDALWDILDSRSGMTKCHVIAAFSAQIGHESVGLSTFEEFASGEAYEGRCKQLGNCNPGDGVKYKGRGAIQVTGRSNYQKVSDYLNEDFINKPDMLVMPSYGFKASVWYWVKNNLNQYCTGTTNDFVELTKRINGGVNGLEDRIERWNRAKSILSC